MTLRPATGIRSAPHTLPVHNYNFQKQNVISPQGGLASLCKVF